MFRWIRNLWRKPADHAEENLMIPAPPPPDPMPPPVAVPTRISDAGLDLIKSHEGLRLNAYLCPAGVLTIGYGHTATTQTGQQITEAQAEALLRQDVQWAEAAVRRNVTVPLTQSQFDALVSFVFNIGEPAFRRSTLLRLLNDGQRAAAADEFARWNKAGNRVLAGLTRRRADEQQLFLS